MSMNEISVVKDEAQAQMQGIKASRSPGTKMILITKPVFIIEIVFVN